MRYETLFCVSPGDIRQVLQEALSAGGDYADIFFEYTTSDEILLRDRCINTVERSADYGVGIRVLKGDRTGYAYSETTDKKAMLSAARMAAAIADAGGPGEVAPHFRTIEVPDRYPVAERWDDFPLKRGGDFLLELDGRLFEASPLVKKTSCSLAFSNSRIMFANSNGESFCEERPLASVFARVSAAKGGLQESFAFSRSFRKGSEMLTPALMAEMMERTTGDIERQFSAIRPKGGEMAVVLAPGSSGILLHEAIGHAFEADFNRKGISIFAGRLGEKICSEKISVVDDATLESNRGAVGIDDEGVPGQKTYMVKEGILTSYLHDRISASHYGVEPTGNGRRESFRYPPLPRMRATYMENGQGSTQDIIKCVKKGIFVDNFTNGEVEIGAGDFTFYVKSGYLIENGHLTAPIKDVNIIGNGPRALAGITEVAADCIVDDSSWTCGKEQYCYVSCGMPGVLVDKLTVGGA